VGTAARVNMDQTIISVETSQQYYAPAKAALRKAGMKLSTPCTIRIEKGSDLIH
jgi:ribosomal protein L16/L10AE